jgi:hypothetical protein
MGAIRNTQPTVSRARSAHIASGENKYKLAVGDFSGGRFSKNWTLLA